MNHDQHDERPTARPTGPSERRCTRFVVMMWVLFLSVGLAYAIASVAHHGSGAPTHPFAAPAHVVPSAG